MRLRTWVALFAPPILWACSETQKAAPDCAGDAQLCPASNMSANTVDCSCTCQLPHIPLPGAKQAKYEGVISACLPAPINADQAAGSDKIALAAMTQSAFNQHVYRFCSDTVADWLSLTIKSQAARFEQLPASLACQPYRCTCETSGARFSETYCQLPCAEQACSHDSCEPVLRQGNVLDVSACSCTRTSACGTMVPEASAPGVCRLPSGLFTRRDRGADWHAPMSLALLDEPITSLLPLARLSRSECSVPERGRGAWRTSDRVE